MVKSKVNGIINYPEIKQMSDEDKEHESNLYKLLIFGRNYTIAIGLPKYKYIEKGIIYYPIYLIKNNQVNSQIGLYEIRSITEPSVRDVDGDIDIDRLGPMLLFSYITKDYLLQLDIDSSSEDSSSSSDDSSSSSDDSSSSSDDSSSSSDDSSSSSDDSSSSSDDSSSSSDDSSSSSDDSSSSSDEDSGKTYSPLEAQDALQADKEREGYIKRPGEEWIQSYMSNKNYSTIDNEGAGDCLFATIRDGLARVGITVTVKGLRKQLSEEATDDVFQGYKTMYEVAIENMHTIDGEIKERKNQYTELVKRAKTTKDRDVLKELSVLATAAKKQYSIAVAEKIVAKSFLQEYEFMSGIMTLEKFKNKINTCDFWGETWAISTLERVLNIKLILFSKAAFVDHDNDNVILCGQLNDSVLEHAGVFKPTHYILLDYLGQHYKLITYKSRGALTFNEVPYDVKTKIVDKCMERAAGPYYLIPAFREFMEKLNIYLPAEESIDLQMAAITDKLYDDRTVLKFYSNSADGPLPGKGSGEQIPPEQVMLYSTLASIPQWRKKLSNFWKASFELDGHQWASVEHYYQASKYKDTDPTFYLSFSLDMNPGSELSIDPLLAKAAGGKSGKFKKELLRAKTITMNPHFFNGTHVKEMKAAQFAKFSQNESLKELLLATNDAKLIHFVRASPPIVFTELMEVRKSLEP